MQYIWSLLWKVSQVASPGIYFRPSFCHCQLGLPTILARMIDEGLTRVRDRFYFWAGSCLRLFCLGLWDGLSCLRSWQLTTQWYPICANGPQCQSWQSTRIAYKEQMGYRLWSLA